jgi:methylenetetrahydrofolate dehydrogenase (NADP+)/methenyltetrahydrofolate cyclohydrolase
MTLILDGIKCSSKIKEAIKKKVQTFKTAPKLAVIKVGDDSASEVYIKAKEKACKEVGIDFLSFKIETREALICKEKGECRITKVITELNADPAVSGILLQLPIPEFFNPLDLISLIDPKKDVDCLHPLNAGRLFLGENGLVPCTPKGCIRLLEENGIKIAGKMAVVVGRSNIVGKPMAQLLLKENATVTICHRHTSNLEEITKNADILISAVGSPFLIKEDMVKKGAVVLDVGIFREPQTGEEKSKLRGDVDFERVKEKASAITPVPGGVGPMTIAMLLENTLFCYEKKKIEPRFR